MANSDDYRQVWYHKMTSNHVWSIQKHCIRPRMSTSAYQYIPSITTLLDTVLIDMPYTIDNNHWLQNMLTTNTTTHNTVWREAETERIVGRWSPWWLDFTLVWRLFHGSCRYMDLFVYFFMNGHLQAMVVLFPCPPSKGVQEATMECSVYYSILFLTPRSQASEKVLHL